MFRARGCTPEESADLAQDAAVRAFVHIRRWGVASGGLDPLLNRIARNLLIDRYRRTSPRLVPLDSAQELHDPEQDPTEEVARRQRRRAVHHAIRELPSRHQRAITYSLSGMTPEEVGKQLGIGRNAADALLHRARRSLKEYLSPVRDGMWGIALAVRVRYDRVMRRTGVQTGVADASQLAALHSSLVIATAAVVGIMSLGGGYGGMPPASGSIPQLKTSPGSATSLTHTVPQVQHGGSDGTSNTIGGRSGGGSWSFRKFAGGTIGPDGTDTRVQGPRNEEGQPLFSIRHRHFGSDEPATDPVGIMIDQAMFVACATAPILCEEEPPL